jgi:putative phosphoribosyl transferase
MWSSGALNAHERQRAGAPVPFANRDAAGRFLASKLVRFAHRPDVLVLGLPRGGVVVAYAVASELNAQLDICLVKKLGVPGHEELAMGAIASGGIVVWNEEVIVALDVPRHAFEAVLKSARTQLEQREQMYRAGRSAITIADRTVILVDDGLATGATMRAAARAVRAQQPAHSIIAVPVGTVSTCMDLRREADEVLCALTPEPFNAVGYWYFDFTQTTDAEVHEFLERSARERPAAGPL